MPACAAPALKYLSAYPSALQAQARQLLEQGRMAQHLLSKYPVAHTLRSNAALHAYASDIKQEAMRRAPPLSKAIFDPQLKVMQHALGTHSRVSRVQGSKLKAKHEVRVDSLFKTVPLEWLRMIVVHELAHFKVAAHDKAFYQLCTFMEPNYHQFELDLRLYLSYRDQQKASAGEADLWT